MVDQIIIRVIFDHGSGTFFWSDNDAAFDHFGDYFIEPNQLPIPQNLWRRAYYLICWRDTILDWINPGGDRMWDEEETERFNQEMTLFIERLKAELPPIYSLNTSKLNLY